MYGSESILILLGLLLLALVALPIIAIVRTLRITRLERRLRGVEAALLRATLEIESLRQSGGIPGGAPPREPASPEPVSATPAQAEPPAATPPTPEPTAPPPPIPPAPAPAPAAAAMAAEPASRHLEEAIGRRWIGWIAIVLIIFSAAFFLKYAFDNQWIGERGRVMIGLLAGLSFVWAGWKRHMAGGRYLSQVLTGGGIVLVYLSTYASFGFYRLVDQTTAFAFLVVVVIQAHFLATAYNSRAIAVMAQIGGFLVPVLLSTGSDQYVVLFSYIAVLNLGVVLVSLRRGWRWVGTSSYALTHLMFWLWYDGNYHPEKRLAVLAFQLAVFLLYLLADLAPAYRRRASSAEEWGRLLANPFVFFATSYHVLHEDYPHWMGAFALVMAALYLGIARAGLSLHFRDRRTIWIPIAVGVLFVTLAIPIQLESNWIAIAWAGQAATLAWLSLRIENNSLQRFSMVLIGLAVFRQLVFDTPWEGRALFTPLLNRYFLSALAVIALILLTAYLMRNRTTRGALTLVIVCVALFWLAMTVETYNYSDALEASLPPDRNYNDVKRIRWFGQTVLSVLWSLYGAGLVAAGFRLRQAALRWAGLAVFGLTLLKVMVIDISQLAQFYRIIAFFALGVLLLGVATAYQRIVRREQKE
jgi:uncharacterized membrane protein